MGPVRRGYCRRRRRRLVALQRHVVDPHGPDVVARADGEEPGFSNGLAGGAIYG